MLGVVPRRGLASEHWRGFSPDWGAHVPRRPRRAGEDRVIPVNPDTLGLRFRQLRAKAGLDGLRLHDGRHTAATRAAEVFDNVLELSAFTGHRSLQTLKRYYHPDASKLAQKLR